MSFKGRHHSEESKRKTSEALKGRIPWNKGKTYRGKPCSEEAKEKLRKANIGKHLSEETKRRMSELRKREKHPNWKGGGNYIYFNPPKGCMFSCMGDCRGYIKLHRLMMAEYLQRPLKIEEVVHHINGDITDNRIENLKLLKNYGEHMSLHKKLREVNLL